MAHKYFYDTGEEKLGPVTGNELVQLRAAGQIDNKTWVRREDSETWRPLGSVDLREEEYEEANPSLWKLLTRHMPVSRLILLVAVLVPRLVEGAPTHDCRMVKVAVNFFEPLGNKAVNGNGIRVI